MENSKSWQQIAKTAQDLRDASINRIHPPVPDVPSDLPTNVTDIPRQLLTTDEILTTERSTEDLVSLLASGKLTSTAVVKAFLRRAGIAQRLVQPLNIMIHAYYTDFAIIDQLCHRDFI